MENRLLFGTAYYPEYMPYERTDQDIAMMKAAGMNTVRIAESTWSTLEPAEGVFDFSYIDRVLEKTEKAGMLVIVGTPTYAVPAWLVRKDPDIMAETSEGREKYGHRQIFDLLNPTFRKHAEIAFGGDSIRSLKDDNYLVLECQAQAFKYWTPYPGQLRLHAYSHLASGAGGLLYWNWHSIHSGYETYWKGILSHDMGTNPAYEEVCRTGQEWKRIGAALCSMKKDNRTALVVDNHSLSAFKWFPIDKDLTYNDVVRWMYDSLYEMNIECDIVDINALEPDRYDMIVTPALYCISEKMLKKLDAFVKNGGVLVSSFKSFVADEYVRVYADTQPHLLQECFGMSCNQYTEPGRTKLMGRQAKYIAELLKPQESAGAESLAIYEHKYWSAYAGITRHEYGRGCAYYVGCYTDKEILKEVYKKAAADAKIAVPAFSWPVIMRSGVIPSTSDGADRTLHYILHYSEEEREIPCPFTAARDILNGREYRAGGNIRLRDWDVLILEEL